MLPDFLELWSDDCLDDHTIISSNHICWELRYQLLDSPFRVRVDPQLPGDVVVLSPAMYSRMTRRRRYTRSY